MDLKVVLILCALLYFLVSTIITVWRLRKVPGPWYCRISSLPLAITSIRSSRYQLVERLHEIYGKVVIIGPRHVSINDSIALREIYGGQDSFRKDDIYTGLAPNSTGLVMEKDPQIHRSLRKIVSTAFSSKAIAKFRLDMKELVPQLTSQLDKLAQSKEVFNIRWWLNLLAIDAIGSFAFKGSFGCLQRGDAMLDGVLDDKVTATRFDMSMDGPAQVAVTTLSFFAELCGGALVRLLMRIPLLKRADALYFSVGNQVLETIEDHRGTDSFIGQYFEACQKHGAEEDFNDLRQHCMNILVAGSTTVSSTISFVIYNLHHNPAVKTKLQGLLDEHFPQKQSVYDWADTMKVPYLRQVIDESMRLAPVVTRGLARTVPTGGYQVKVDAKTYDIPKGMTVSVPLYSLFRTPAFQNANTFNPDRWEQPSNTMKDSFQPFSIGTRNCIGQEIARSEMMILLTTLLRNYDFTLEKEPELYQAGLETKPLAMELTIRSRP